MDVVDYENIVETPLNVADSNNAWPTNNSDIPWVNSPMIDASVSVINIPEATSWPDIAWWSTDIVRSATDYNTVAWTAGAIKLADGTSYSIDAGNTGNISAVNYIYADIGTPSATLLKTTTAATSVGTGKLLLCVCQNVSDTTGLAKFQAFGTLGLGIFITADNIAANTITANEIASNTITTSQLSAGAIDGMTITGALIRTAASWQRLTIDTSLFRLYDTDAGYDWWADTLCWLIYWQIFNFSNLWLQPTTMMKTWSVLYVDSAAWIVMDSPYLYTGAIKVCPWYSNVDIWDTTTAYRNLYLSWTIDFDNWDWIFWETAWHPQRNSLYMPYRSSWWWFWNASRYVATTSWWSPTSQLRYISLNVAWTDYQFLII